MINGAYHGMIPTMRETKTKIDGAGRVVIPSEIRQAMRLTADTPLQLRLVNGVLEIEPESNPANFVKKGRLVVASLAGKPRKLTQEETEKVRQEIYTDRTEQLIAPPRGKK